MPYFLLVVGLIMIFISLRGTLKKDAEDKTLNPFADILEVQIKDKEIQKLNEKIEELNSKLANIEDSLLLIGNFSEETAVDNKKAADISFDLESSQDIADTLVINKFSEKKSDVNNTIYELYDNGSDIENICSTLGLGKGEVLLRLGLRKQQQ